MRSAALAALTTVLLIAACDPAPPGPDGARRRDAGSADTASGDAALLDAAPLADAATGSDLASAADRPSSDATAAVDAAAGAVLSADERQLASQMWSVGYKGGELMRSTIALAADALWFCTCTTGTLTQDAQGAWSHASEPTDRMVLLFNFGLRTELFFTYVDGYMQGSAEDFTLSHALTLRVVQGGGVDHTLVSVTNPDANGVVQWNRSLRGTAPIDQQLTTLDLTHTGSRAATVDVGFASYDFQETYSGTAQTATATTTIAESSRRQLMHNSDLGQHAMNDERRSNSTVSQAGHSYAYSGLYVAYAGGSILGDPGTFNVVIDPSFWQAQGQFRRDGQVVGSVQFSGPVVASSNGPDLVLRLTSGQDVLLHTLLD